MKYRARRETLNAKAVPYHVKGKIRWCVSHYFEGRRVRMRFKTQEGAQAHADKLNFENRGMQQRDALYYAWALLDEYLSLYGETLLELGKERLKNLGKPLPKIDKSTHKLLQMLGAGSALKKSA